MRILNYRQFEKFNLTEQEPKQRSFPGEEQTIKLPSGEEYTGIVDKINIDQVIPVQEDEDVWNETSKGYAKGLFVEFDKDIENYYDEGDIKSEDNLPPIVIDQDMKIIDGHHRWAALKMAGFKKINVIKK